MKEGKEPEPEPLTYEDMVSLLPGPVWIRCNTDPVKYAMMIIYIEHCGIIGTHSPTNLTFKALADFWEFTTDGRNWYRCTKKGLWRMDGRRCDVCGEEAFVTRGENNTKLCRKHAMAAI
jgi:hypothetical protein